MQPVTADQGKKGREERAALRTGPNRDHAGELPYFQREEAGPEHEGDEGRQVGGGMAPRANRQGHQPAGVARSEKAAGFDRNAALVEQLGAGRTASGRVSEHRVTGEQRSEHHDVAQKEYPEAVSNHNPLCSGTSLACARPRLVPNLISNCNSDVHTAISAWFTCSNRAIRSAEIPIAPAPAIHQICQISAKPVTTAKNAVMNPVALFFGTSIGSNLRSFSGC